MLRLPQTVYDQLREHGEAAYPDECCGILLGTAAGEVKTVTRAVPASNASPHPHHHYEIAPIDLIHIERAATASGESILGFYHSHPDHPAHWSLTDLAEAHWIGCSYLITSVENGRASASHSFHLAGTREEDKHFQSEKIALMAAPELANAASR